MKRLVVDGYIFETLVFLLMLAALRPDVEAARSTEANNSTYNNQAEFFRHIKWLTNRFVDYKYFCSSEFGKHSPYAIIDNQAATRPSDSSALGDLKTKNIWILRNKKCMNFSNVKMNYYEASRVCSKNHFKQTRLLHRKEMSFLLKNSNSHYKGINVYELYAKLNRKPVTEQTNQKSYRSANSEQTSSFNSQLDGQSYREYVFLPVAKQQQQDDSRQSRSAPKPVNPRANLKKSRISMLAAKKYRPQQSPFCEDPVEDFQIWLNDDNTYAGFECSTIDKAPVIKFNPRECKNGCFDCVARNTSKAYFVCVKNCDWKVPYGSYCNTMNRAELYLYENLYFQQEELIYLCQGQLECIDYTCKCSKHQQLRREHFCE